MSGEHGRIMLIGGNEDKKGECRILKKFVQLMKDTSAKLLVLTAATDFPRETGVLYKGIFQRLGCTDVVVLDVKDRGDASSTDVLQLLQGAGGVFFTGGDQLQLTSVLGGTAFMQLLACRLSKGMLLGGTSAGASVMSSTMIIQGDSDESPQLTTLKMAPGFGFLPGVVIDQHFAQRGRIGRLLTAVGQNPAVLGLGLDEDTAIIVEGQELLVWGRQTVTILDGSQVSHTNVSQSQPEQYLALTDVRLHVLPHGYRLNLEERKPLPPIGKAD